MEVEEVFGTGAFVEVVDVLGDEEDVAAVFLFEKGEGEVGGVGMNGAVGETGAAHVVEALDGFGIAFEGFGSGNVLDTVAFPEAVGTTEGGES